MKSTRNVALVYFDESGDDGNNTDSCNHFVLTGTLITVSKWKSCQEEMSSFRKKLKKEYGLYVDEELHWKNLFYDKDPYRKYNWTVEQRQELISAYINHISTLPIKIISVVIQKKEINDPYFNVLEKAISLSIEKIDKESKGNFRYILITDKGRTPAMRRAIRKICNTAELASQSEKYRNKIEDILDKDSKDSHFIQISDYIATIIGMYFNYCIQNEDFPKRLSQIINKEYIYTSVNILSSFGTLIPDNSQNKNNILTYPQKNQSLTGKL